jgi:hypothetical protein
MQEPATKPGTCLCCNKSAFNSEQAKRHGDLVRGLLSQVQAVREMSVGYEWEFVAGTALRHQLDERAALERVCCPFLEIDIQSGNGSGNILLRLKGREEAKEVMREQISGG